MYLLSTILYIRRYISDIQYCIMVFAFWLVDFFRYHSGGRVYTRRAPVSRPQPTAVSGRIKSPSNAPKGALFSPLSGVYFFSFLLASVSLAVRVCVLRHIASAERRTRVEMNATRPCTCSALAINLVHANPKEQRRDEA